MTINSIRTMTYENQEVYARTHIQGVDGLVKATPTMDGLMSKEDKSKLDSLQNFDPALLSNATPNSPGLMSPQDKAKLDNLNTNSNPYSNVNGQSSGKINVQSQLLVADTNVWPSETQRVNLPKNLSNCRTGIILVWRLDNSDEFYHYQHIPKYHVKHAGSKVAKAIPINNTAYCNKVIYVHDTHIIGIVENYSTSTKANYIRLHEILEY